MTNRRAQVKEINDDDLQTQLCLAPTASRSFTDCDTPPPPSRLSPAAGCQPGACPGQSSGPVPTISPVTDPRGALGPTDGPPRSPSASPCSPPLDLWAPKRQKEASVGRTPTHPRRGGHPPLWSSSWAREKPSPGLGLLAYLFSRKARYCNSLGRIFLLLVQALLGTGPCESSLAGNKRLCIEPMCLQHAARLGPSTFCCVESSPLEAKDGSPAQ